MSATLPLLAEEAAVGDAAGDELICAGESCEIVSAEDPDELAVLLVFAPFKLLLLLVVRGKKLPALL